MHVQKKDEVFTWRLYIEKKEREKAREREQSRRSIISFLHFVKRKDIIYGCHICPCMGIMREEMQKKKRKERMHNESKKKLARWSTMRNTPDSRHTLWVIIFFSTVR